MGLLFKLSVSVVLDLFGPNQKNRKHGPCQIDVAAEEGFLAMTLMKKSTESFPAKSGFGGSGLVMLI